MLSRYKDQAIRAHHNTSFSPERRGESIVKEFSEMLREDLESLGENSGNYRVKFENYFSEWIGAKSRCMSSFITGPSNFPINKAMKANNAEHNKYEKFMAWRKKYIQRANRIPTPTPEDDLQSALEDVDSLIFLQEKMKIVNKLIRKYKEPALIAEKIREEELMSESDIQKKILNVPDFMDGMGFPRYKLTNNNAKIKARKEKVLIMKSRIETKSEWKAIEFDGGMIDIENDRVIIKHDEKPDQEVIQKIKSFGFRWSRNYECWSRKHTQQAIRDAKNIIGVV